MKITFGVVLLLPGYAFAQNQLPLHPRYTAWQTARSEIQKLDASVRQGNPLGWSADSKFVILSQSQALDISTGKRTEFKAPVSDSTTARRQGPGRGRQYTSYQSPDGKHVASYSNFNITLATGSLNKQITTEGSVETRIKYGSASWVYGEELNQNEAMWWSGDSTKLVYYRFDESKTPDYYVTLGQGLIQNKLYPEAYPKAGASNPTVKLFSYDVKSGVSTQIDTEFKGSDPNISEYIYGVRFAPDGKTLLFNRTNRQQNAFELCAMDIADGKPRVVIQESNPTGWVKNSPSITWLKDGRHFLWISERTGFYNVYISSLDRNEIKPITKHPFEVEAILKVDEQRQEIWYSAHSSANPYLLQVHRISMNGTGDVRMTDPSMGHSARIAPDGSGFIDDAEMLEMPRTTTIRDRDGKLIKTELGIAESPYKSSKYKPAKRFTCKAADGVTDIYGYYRLPSDFDPTKKYPVVLAVYGGPESGRGVERFIGADADCEYGIITAWIDGRGTRGRGRNFRQSVYKKLGIVEIDDQAAAIRQMAMSPFVDSKRIGIHGTSYGGYASAMALLRYPDVFSAAVASSSVTTWENYDSIYTERFMDTPQRNPEGYNLGSAMTYAKNLTGNLCLFYGTADDNVHPSNTHQLIRALDTANKPYKLFVGVDQGHAGLRQDRQMEFFLESFGMLK